MTDVRKAQNRVSFADASDEYGDSAMGRTSGVLGKGGIAGQLRSELEKKQKWVVKKRMKGMSKGKAGMLQQEARERRMLRKVNLGNSGATSGLASTLAFTPMQAMELEEEKKSFFSKRSATKEYDPYRVPQKCPPKSDETCVTYGFDKDYITALGRDKDELVNRWIPPVGGVELYQAGEYTLSGGVASSSDMDICESFAILNKKCVLPCQTRGAQDINSLWLPRKQKLSDIFAYETSKYGSCIKRRAHGKPLEPPKLPTGLLGGIMLETRSSLKRRNLRRFSTTNFFETSSRALKKGPGGDEWEPEWETKKKDSDTLWGQCICADPCSLYMSCSECTANKSDLRYVRLGQGASPLDCGWCGNVCISGSKDGPAFAQECMSEWAWTGNQCDERQNVTIEDFDPVIPIERPSDENDNGEDEEDRFRFFEKLSEKSSTKIDRKQKKENVLALHSHTNRVKKPEPRFVGIKPEAEVHADTIMQHMIKESEEKNTSIDSEVSQFLATIPKKKSLLDTFLDATEKKVKVQN
eukprot:g601.t1